MPDRLSPERRSWLMSRVRGTDTTPEIALRKALYALGIRGWRVHPKNLPGKPDVIFPRWGVVVFVDGAFWHGHPSKFSPGRLPKAWEQKIAANMSRDSRVDSELRALGWRVLRVWDFEIRKNPLEQAEKVRRALARRGYSSTRAVDGTPSSPLR